MPLSILTAQYINGLILKQAVWRFFSVLPVEIAILKYCFFNLALLIWNIIAIWP
jgi:hypothetical protein